MARINLLPWRVERRKQRQKEFGLLMMAALAFGAIVAYGIVFYYDDQIAGQTRLNSILQTEITGLDARIKEIESLEATKSRLLARKQVIEQLQADRSKMVHLFDELVRTIPDGVQLTSIKQSGQRLTMEGISQSNARVSTYMRNLDASEWMTKPDLKVIEAKSGNKALPYVFTLEITLTKPGKTAEDEMGDDLAGGAL